MILNPSILNTARVWIEQTLNKRYPIKTKKERNLTQYFMKKKVDLACFPWGCHAHTHCSEPTRVKIVEEI